MGDLFQDDFDTFLLEVIEKKYSYLYKLIEKKKAYLDWKTSLNTYGTYCKIRLCRVLDGKSIGTFLFTAKIHNNVDGERSLTGIYKRSVKFIQL